MNKNYNTRRINQKSVYSVKEISELFMVNIRTIRRWIKEGLTVIPETYPYLIQGSVLKKFLKDMQAKRKTKLADNEIYCVKCKKAVKPYGNVHLIYSGKTLGNGLADFNIEGICPNCKGRIFRLSNDGLKNIVIANFKVEGEVYATSIS